MWIQRTQSLSDDVVSASGCVEVGSSLAQARRRSTTLLLLLSKHKKHRVQTQQGTEKTSCGSCRALSQRLRFWLDAGLGLVSLVLLVRSQLQVEPELRCCENTNPKRLWICFKRTSTGSDQSCHHEVKPLQARSEPSLQKTGLWTFWDVFTPVS